MVRNQSIWRKIALTGTRALGLALIALSSAQAGNDDGSVVGRTVAGALVTVVSATTGLTRSVSADAQGNYRFPFLPVGEYVLKSSKDGAAVGKPVNVTVSLGNATSVNLASEAAELETIQVTATRVVTAVDVTSIEQATNITREELRRLPVDQNIASVAVLAPGVNAGNASFGGISFGGSSIAENSFYVNGLNVTDFYNRNGFSQAPFAFYQEFQVKTGGYSVEFGRSTGGVVNAVTRSGGNDFHYGAELTTEPAAWQAAAHDYVRSNGDRYITSSKDQNSLTKLNLFTSGALIRDKLFFFLMYEARDAEPRNTNNAGTVITDNKSGDGFWGGKLDWHINQSNLLELMAFSDKNKNTGDVFAYNFDTATKGAQTDTVYNDTGGANWALTYTSYLTNDLSMKLLYGRNERNAYTRALSDVECNLVYDDGVVPSPGVPLGCASNGTIEKRLDIRQAARADFEWKIHDHLLRFGLDHEQNTSDYSYHYSGPNGIAYSINAASPGDTLFNGGVVPPGYTAYVRARRYEIAGTFQTINSAYYLEDNWSITPNLLLNGGLRLDGFNNKDGSGHSYIKMNDQWAPRFGFSWNMHGDGTTKLFGNLGRYFLPVANVINIKQAGGLLDQRTYYGFGGYRIEQRNGSSYAVPILGPQIGPVDTSQGDGTVPDQRSSVSRDMEPVHQDELILGLQQVFRDKWSWGVSGTYRKLHNAIDDMQITATPQCGGNGYVGWVMANPGRPVTVWGDTHCTGVNDGWITIDTSKQGWALYDSNGNYLGQRGWNEPKRTYEAIEFQIDRAWDDKWEFNASYTWSRSQGNAEGPVNSDTEFDDAGRTENFDDPWVNFFSGDLPNDRRHQFKARGTYALTPHWHFGANLDLASGTPITGYGVGNPYDATNYVSYFICKQNCDGPSPGRVYEASPRGGYGHTPWTYTLDANVAYLMPLGTAGKLRVKFSVYNLLNQQRAIAVDQGLQNTISNSTNPYFGEPIRSQAPRFAQLVLSADF